MLNTTSLGTIHCTHQVHPKLPLKVQPTLITWTYIFYIHSSNPKIKTSFPSYWWQSCRKQFGPYLWGTHIPPREVGRGGSMFISYFLGGKVSTNQCFFVYIYLFNVWFTDAMHFPMATVRHVQYDKCHCTGWPNLKCLILPLLIDTLRHAWWSDFIKDLACVQSDQGFFFKWRQTHPWFVLTSTACKWDSIDFLTIAKKPKKPYNT